MRWNTDSWTHVVHQTLADTWHHLTNKGRGHLVKKIGDWKLLNTTPSQQNPAQQKILLVINNNLEFMIINDPFLYPLILHNIRALVSDATEWAAVTRVMEGVMLGE